PSANCTRKMVVAQSRRIENDPSIQLTARLRPQPNSDRNGKQRRPWDRHRQSRRRRRVVASRKIPGAEIPVGQIPEIHCQVGFVEFFVTDGEVSIRLGEIRPDLRTKRTAAFARRGHDIYQRARHENIETKTANFKSAAPAMTHAIVPYRSRPSSCARRAAEGAPDHLRKKAA